VSIDPSFIFETEATRATARPEVMRFYEGESGLRVDLLFSSAGLGDSRSLEPGTGGRNSSAPRGQRDEVTSPSASSALWRTRAESDLAEAARAAQSARGIRRSRRGNFPSPSTESRLFDRI